MRTLNVFFRFHKKVWIPLLIILLLWGLQGIIEPYIPQIMQIAFAIIFQIAQVVAWIFLFFGILGSRIRVNKYKAGDLDLNWSDYRGNDGVLERVKAWVKYLQGSESYDAMGGEHEPGVLLTGKPGVGKTHLAKVLASVAGAPLWSVDCQSLLGTFVGMGPLKVSGLFRGIKNEATKSGKGAILFLDEIDSIGGARGGMNPNIRYMPWEHGFWEGPHAQMPGGMGGMGMGGQILNTILSELDGMGEKVTWNRRLMKNLAKWLGYKEGDWFYRVFVPPYIPPKVMVICSTNRPDILDPALTRRGRIGWHLQVDLPTMEGLKDLAQYYLEEHRHPTGVYGVAHDDTLTIEAIAKSAAGRTPADIKYFLNSAVQVADRQGKKKVDIHDWMHALAEGTLGSKNPLPLSETERQLLATHEAGHAIVLQAVARGRLDVQFLTIERYGRALGHMYPVETLTWYLGATKSMLEAALCILFAGAAAEQEIAKSRHNSMGGDLPGIWNVVHQMAFNGMLGKFPMSPDDKSLNRLMRAKMEEMWNRACEIVRQNKSTFEVLVPVLAEKGTMVGTEVMALVGDKVKPWKESEDEAQN